MSDVAALVFARCAGFVFRAPGFSHPSVPPAFRAGLALFFTVALLPGVGTHPTHAATLFAVRCIIEFGIGSALGFATSVLYDGAYAAGRVLDDYAGIRSSIPTITLNAPSGFGRIWSLAFLSGFFLLDGYRVIVLALAQSFALAPPGGPFDEAHWRIFALSLPALVFKAAVFIAAPALGVAFLVQCALGALSRVVPRFQSFTLGFPLVFASVLLMTALTLPVLCHGTGHPWIILPFDHH
ncbi:MAG: flagellar biosynthetic protein FliR [Vulcanimicrobiaceae bacterium]